MSKRNARAAVRRLLETFALSPRNYGHNRRQLASRTRAYCGGGTRLWTRCRRHYAARRQQDLQTGRDRCDLLLLKSGNLVTVLVGQPQGITADIMLDYPPGMKVPQQK